MVSARSGTFAVTVGESRLSRDLRLRQGPYGRAFKRRSKPVYGVVKALVTVSIADRHVVTARVVASYTEKGRSVVTESAVANSVTSTPRITNPSVNNDANCSQDRGRAAVPATKSARESRPATFSRHVRRGSAGRIVAIPSSSTSTT